MIPPLGEYRYEILKNGQIVGVEEERLASDRLSGVRIVTAGGERNEVEARLGPEGEILNLNIRYARGPFSRSASYQVDGDFLRGSVEALAGRNAVEAKLGRFREVDGDFVLFKTLIIARIRARGQRQFTGRIATIDPKTLVAASRKQIYRQRDAAGLWWTYEPAMAELEEIELDEAGRLLRRSDRRGSETVVRHYRPAG
jgi:hypothetical protein